LEDTIAAAGHKLAASEEHRASSRGWKKEEEQTNSFHTAQLHLVAAAERSGSAAAAVADLVETEFEFDVADFEELAQLCQLNLRYRQDQHS
jgi:hypothetical protein